MKAKEALISVGLGSKLNKRPNQLSNGQLQRVAVARALVDNPSIILADEPTGALDTENSIQVLKLLKELSKERLVIMVTHNVELANECSDRIIHLLDGEITSDETINDTKRRLSLRHSTAKDKRYMRYFTALKLSFFNLTKKIGTSVVS